MLGEVVAMAKAWPAKQQIRREAESACSASALDRNASAFLSRLHRPHLASSEISSTCEWDHLGLRQQVGGDEGSDRTHRRCKQLGRSGGRECPLCRGVRPAAGFGDIAVAGPKTFHCRWFRCRRLAAMPGRRRAEHARDAGRRARDRTPDQRSSLRGGVTSPHRAGQVAGGYQSNAVDGVGRTGRTYSPTLRRA